jgi:glyoxylase-like metal-dependent hydrolase (beta-lactamase superfamily II)
VADPEWTAPGAAEIAPGVHRIPLPLPQDGLRAVNVYALTHGEDLVLIDAGWAIDAARRQLSESLAQLGRELGDIRRFLVTHAHRDHYTQAVTIRRIFGSRVSIGVDERDSIEGAGQGAGQGTGRSQQTFLKSQLPRLRRTGAQSVGDAILAAGLDHALDPTDWEPPDDWLEDGMCVDLGGQRLRVVATPGHTVGHMVFVDEGNRLLFAGDHVLPHITPSIGFEPDSGRLPLGDYLASLRVVRSMPDMRLLPAHGPVTDSVHARVDELLHHHEVRLAACRRAVDAGAGTAHEAARRLRWTRRERRFDELDPFNQMLAIIETEAHLDLLAAQGRIRRAQQDDGLVVYNP